MHPTDPALGPGLLHAPWRLPYLETLSDSAPPKANSTGSFLRDYWLAPQSDAANHVIVRTRQGMVLLNAYPYANGHLLVALADARPRLLDYDEAQRAELWRLTDLASDLIDHALAPQGINIGINQGKAAGAGVPSHIHVHLVPRWNGDVNFSTVIARVRVLPSSLEAMATRYRSAWDKIKAKWTS